MVKRILFGFFILGLAIMPLRAQFDSGSTGADSAFNPPSQVPPGTRVEGDCTRAPGCTVTVPLPPDGVFNFTTIAIGQFVTVSFRPNGFNTPVTILAQGDVVIAGTISVNGSNGQNWQGAAGGLGGPGGFRGGDGGRPGASLLDRIGGAGLGPGGGLPVAIGGCGGGSGAFGSAGTGPSGSPSGPTYGRETLLPLTGGSGGSGGGCSNTFQFDYHDCNRGTLERGGGGGGGGGAILIASSTTITINGAITADGGIGGANLPGSGCPGFIGSGGGIRLIANSITGTGTVSAQGPLRHPERGGDGRIRLKSGTDIPGTLRINPGASRHIFQAFAPPAVVVPGLPTLRIATVDGVAVPFPPQGQFGPTDVTVTNPGTKPVGLAASGIPLGTTIQVTIKPEVETALPTTYTSTALTGTLESSTAMANVNLPALASYYLEARATFTAASAGPETGMKIDGEKVKQIRVETAQGTGSKVIYILESGKEVPAEKAGNRFKIAGGKAGMKVSG